MLAIAVVGTGRVGTTLAVALMRLGYRVSVGVNQSGDCFGNHPFHQATGAPVLGLADTPELNHLLGQADIVLVTTTDAAISPVAQWLATHTLLRPNTVVLHTAGAHTSALLAPLSALGMVCGSMHPLQTIADVDSGLRALPGTYYAVEGHPHAVRVASALIESLGGQCLKLDGRDRVRYHAAAVLASNALIALANVAVEVLGTESALAALLPLISGSVQTLQQQGLPNALTGPIERCDVKTVQAHLRALQDIPSGLSVYITLGRVTAQLAFRKGSLTEAERDAFYTDFDACEVTVTPSNLGGM